MCDLLSSSFVHGTLFFHGIYIVCVVYRPSMLPLVTRIYRLMDAFFQNIQPYCNK